VLKHIGNAGTKAMAWVEHMALSVSPQVMKAKELEKFTEGIYSLFDRGEPLGIATRRQLETFFGYDLGEVRIHRGERAEEASRRLGARAFTFREHIFAPQQNLDITTRKGLGLLAHELTHAIQQTEPRRLPQGETAGRNTGSAPAALPSGHSDIGMVLLAPTGNASSTGNPQQREAQAQAIEQQVTEGLDNKDKSSPEINYDAVTDRVYRLMQSDLRVERERAPKLGGKNGTANR